MIKWLITLLRPGTRHFEVLGPLPSGAWIVREGTQSSTPNEEEGL